MAKPKITFYDLSDREYRKIIDTINVERKNERTAWIVVDEMKGIMGDPLKYNLTLSVKTREGSYSKPDKDKAINIIKGLVSLLNFD